MTNPPAGPFGPPQPQGRPPVPPVPPVPAPPGAHGVPPQAPTHAQVPPRPQYGVPQPQQGAPDGLYGTPQQPYGQPPRPGYPQQAYLQQPQRPQRPPRPPRQPISKKAKRRIIGWLVTVGVLALLGVASVVTLNIINSTRGPEAVVSDYLQLIAEGKAEEATAVFAPSGSRASKDLLTNAVMTAEGVTLMKVGKLTSTTDGDTGVVTAKLSVGSEEFTARIKVKQGPKEFLVLNTWQVNSALVYAVTLETSDTSVAARVAGTPVSVDSYDSQEYLLYPGQYPITSSSPSTFYSDIDTSVTVKSGRTARVYLERDLLTDEIETAVLEQVKREVQRCASVPTNMNMWCPYAVQNRNLESMTVTQTPSGLSDFSDYEDGSGWFESTTAKISVLANPTTLNPKPVAREVDFALYGYWEIIDGKLEITYSSW